MLSSKRAERPLDVVRIDEVQKHFSRFARSQEKCDLAGRRGRGDLNTTPEGTRRDRSGFTVNTRWVESVKW
jgi:hypothetical protein